MGSLTQSFSICIYVIVLFTCAIKSEGCDLKCWLANITLDIPPQNMDSNGFAISTNNMKVILRNTFESKIV